MATILSVDDDAVNQTVIEFLLEGNGYTVVQAMDGIEALDYLRTAPELPAVVLMDCMMPRLSGYEATRRIRELYPPHLPVIMISAKASKEDIIQGLQCQANDYVTKPFDKEELLARIQVHIKLNKIREEQEVAERKLALSRLAVPQDLVLPPTDPVVALSIFGDELEHMKAFIDFLARKFDLHPIPTRTGCYCAVALGEPSSATQLSVGFAKAVTEYIDANHQSRVLVFLGLGPAKSAVYQGEVPSLLVYGEAADELRSLSLSCQNIEGTAVICSKSVFRLVTARSDMRILHRSDDSVVFTFSASASLAATARPVAESFAISGSLDRELPADLERVVTALQSHPLDQTQARELGTLIARYNAHPTETEADSIIAFLRSVSRRAVADAPDEEMIGRLEQQTAALEKEYTARTAQVNETLRKVLQLESLNEMLFLELKRRQFETRPFIS